MDAAALKTRRKRRELILQTLLVVAVALIVWAAISTAQTKLDELNMTSGFGFLERATGWAYSFSLIDRSIDDSYSRTLLIGFMNTLFLGLICIVLSTILGFAIGTARDARQLGLNAVATVYIQLFRNLPLILQLVFWYAILIHMPGPRQAYSLGDALFLSNRGMMLPALNVSPLVVLGIFACLVLLGFAIFRIKSLQFLHKLGLWLVASIGLTLTLASMFAPAESSMFSIPVQKGLRFQGGLTVSIELVAMILAITLYGSAYIAEVVRGGLHEVPSGLTEAGKALGLSSRSIWFHVKIPMALRTIMPPLGNQWIFIMKATTLGVAIGFSDLFYIVSTSITQSGQTLELMGLLMLSFLLINYSLAQIVNFINARLALKGH
ncbi:ABC transporter permease subunit [uncultured Roseibium sp.]|uniref:ABC transporter permease subunit n=1 Tax=uncultured Roseibium sp. TaxID=1936171 RepID=UPI002609570D|nr:ABC transporter permease subunit [uncultured Roseibium sp.]